MPYYIKKDKEDDERPKRKPLRRTPLKRVSDKRMAELKAGKSKPVTSVKKASKPKSRKKSTLIRELDKVFSLYVRMRDSKEFGFKYFRCISCGQVKSFDQGDAGHFYSRTRMSVRFNENNVNMECAYCMTPKAKVVLANGKKIRLRHVHVGQALLAFDESPLWNLDAIKVYPNGYDNEPELVERRFKTAYVTHVEKWKDMIYRVTLESGKKIDVTRLHLWLTKRGWIDTACLYEGVDEICIPRYKKGAEFDESFDYTLDKVISVRMLRKGSVVIMETSTRTFIGDGCAMHNCNRFSADHLIGYRENLIHKIGKQSFDMLTVEANMSRQWHEFELEQMIKYYRARTQQLVEEEKTDNAALFSKNKFGKN